MLTRPMPEHDGDAYGGRFIAPRHNQRAYAEALYSLSQTQRRLAHRASQAAFEAARDGHRKSYAFWQLESRRLWRDAWSHFEWARQEFSK